MKTIIVNSKSNIRSISVYQSLVLAFRLLVFVWLGVGRVVAQEKSDSLTLNVYVHTHYQLVSAVMKALRQQRYEDKRIRDSVEGEIGKGKRRYSTDRVMTKLRETSETVISMVYLVMNLDRLLREGASSYLMRIYLRLKA